ncbi:thioredoxin domain-containing protein [bacterium]|nr:thioredoxin domain-containing protein [bacterium]
MFSLILGFIAILNAAYLTLLSVFKSATCIAGGSCIDAISSEYGQVLGIPTAYFGVVFFTVLTYLMYQRHVKQNPSFLLEGILLCLGTLLSLYFVFVQLFILNSVCLLCTLSAIIVFILFGLFILTFRDSNPLQIKPFFPPFKPIFRDSLILIISLILVYALPKIFFHQYTINITPKIAATSSIKSWTVKELDTLTGITYPSIQSELYKNRKTALINTIIQHDANQLNLTLNQYYNLFVRRSFSQDHQPTRQHIRSLNGNLNRIQQLINSKTLVDISNMHQRYNALQMDILNFYDVELKLARNFFINVRKNAYADIKVGSPQAPIQISVFSDFLCSHCAHFHAQLEPILKQYPSVVSVTFRHYSHQGDRSQALSRASICAHKQNQFLPVAHSIYVNQKDITVKTLPTFLEKLSSFDISRWETCMSSAYPMNVLAEDQKESKRLGLQATPTVIVNGYLGNLQLIQTEIHKYLRKNT